MQSARAGTERDVHSFRVIGYRLRAVPVTGAAVDAFLAVEGRHAAYPGGNGLAGTKLNTDLRAASLTKLRVEEDDMVGIAGRCLHFAPEQQRVLVRHEQLAVMRYRRPTASLHERAVERYAFNRALLAELLNFGLGNSAAVVFFNRGDAFVGLDWLAVE